MTTRAAAIEKQARTLTPAERERLAERLLIQVSEEPLTAVDQAWVDEAEKRFSAWKQKKTKPVPAQHALRQIRKALHR
jgi:Putative addiction module component